MELFKQFVEGSFSKYFKGRIKSTNQVFTDKITTLSAKIKY